MACLEWPAEKGACPSRAEALVRFGGKSCVGEIESVDSDGEVSDGVCCYDVTKRGAGELGCGASGGASPAGGSASTGACGGCAAVRAGTASELCPGSAELFDALETCLCSGPCAAACDDGSCATSFDAPECQACVADEEMGCGQEMAACEADL